MAIQQIGTRGGAAGIRLKNRGISGVWPTQETPGRFAGAVSGAPISASNRQGREVSRRRGNNEVDIDVDSDFQ
jgi:hypothetical protein